MVNLKYLFCLCLILAPAIEANPTSTPSVEVSAEQLRIEVGKSGSVTCTPVGNPLPSVQWKKHEGDFGAGTQASGNTLTISDAQVSDQGYYACVAVLGATEVNQKYVYVEIENARPPSRGNLIVTVSQRTLRIPRGGNGSIDCTPEGHPLPTVQWKKADGEFRDGVTQSGNTLVISDAREEDRGHYACQGIVDGTVMVTDYSAIDVEDTSEAPRTPENPTVTVSQKTLRIPRGGRGSVECTPKGNPLPKVQWIKSNGELRSGIGLNGNTLTISDAQKEDQGHYVCQGIVDGTVMITAYAAVVVEDVDSSAQSNLKVTVSQRTLLIPRGGRGTIECTPEGNPLPTVQWIKSDGEFRDGVTQSGNTLVISDAREEDRGHYVCQGIVDGTVMLTNYSAIEIDSRTAATAAEKSKVEVSVTRLKISMGKSGSVTCNPGGSPLPSIQWRKHGGELGSRTSVDDNTLTINEAQEGDQGYYMCVGVVGSAVVAQKYVYIEIENARPPSRGNLKVTVSQRTLSIPRGGNGSIDCTPEGHPLPTVQWKKADGEFRDGVTQSGNKLVISDAREEDRGHYACQGIVDGTVMVTDYSAIDVEDTSEAPRTPENPTVTVSQKTLRIPRGGRGSVECTPKGNPLPKVQWIKSNGELRSGIGLNGNTLTISDAQKEDQGHYVCQGIVDGTVMITAYAAVVVEDVDSSAQSNLKVTVSQRTLLIPRGERGTIECTPEGNPLPTVQWIKSDGEFRDGVTQSGNTLVISDAREEDRGHYVCQGIVDGTVMLTNYSAIEIDSRTAATASEKSKVEVSVTRLKISMGKSGSVKCNPAGSPLPSIQWRKHGGELGSRTSVDDNTLTINEAQEGDQGYYMCVGVVGNAVVAQKYVYIEIEKGISQTTSARNLKLILSERQLRIPEGGNGSIECTPEGDPLLSVQWIKADGEFRDGVTQSGNTLVISDAREEDRGHYACQGIVDGTVMLTNYSAVDIESRSPPPSLESSPPVTQQTPRTSENPKVTVSEKQLRIALGGTGTIECTPEGYPLPTVQWMKADGELRSGIEHSGSTLVISDAREEDRGHYVCNGIVDGTVMVTDYSKVEIYSKDERESSEGIPDYLPAPINAVISEGTDARISCDFETGDIDQQVTWTRRDQFPLPQNAQEGNELVIRSATNGDSGEYLCKVTASRGGFLLRVAYFRLEVLVRPLVSIRPLTQTASRGQAVSVECAVDGNGARVTWDRVDGSLSSRVENRGSQLYFNGIELEDAGYYRCSAQNRAGVSSGIAKIIVNDAGPPTRLPGYLKLIVSQRQLKIPEGGNGSIECTPEGDPLPRVQWIKSNGEFRDGVTQSGNTLVISDAREEDRGHYACQGIVDGTVMLTNYSAVDISAGPQTSSPANLRSSNVIVSQKQATIRRGESVAIECTPVGNPIPTVQWIKADGEFRDGVTQSGNKLVISDAREEDRGHYACQGIVDGTVMVTDYSAVDVRDELPTSSPANLRSINVVVSDKQVTIAKGESASIECTPEGNPLPTVQWIKADGEFRDGVTQSGNKLVISDAREEDRGHYACQGIVDGTVMVTDYSAVDVESDRQPPAVAGNSRVQVDVRKLKIPKGGNGTVDCLPEGNPLPTVQWSKHDGDFGVGTRQSGNSLIISDAQEQDGGYYVCDGMVDGTSAWTDYLAVEIESKASITQALSYPRVTVNIRQLRIPRGGSMAVDCTPEGYPLPTIQWSKDEGSFAVGTEQRGNSLVISDAQEGDSGNYVCSAVVDGDTVFSDYLTVEIQYICELPKEVGSCRAAFDRWYYDSRQQKCQRFTWGGCGGNKNNFETEEQCSLECESMRPYAA